MRKLTFACVLILLWSIAFQLNAQNLLNTSSWTVGTGSVSGFSQNGVTAENSRELGKNHIGKQVVLWKASPESVSGPDGGWNSSLHTINHTVTHRFSVWIKKTNSNSGTTYFGCWSTNNILTLSGVVNNNPYFWAGDLPKLNRWYLIVGFVHKSNHAGTTNIGGIYDGTTGEKVTTITDFKFKSGTPSVSHRSYLYYDTNTLNRQYFYAPRIDPINGNEPSIDKLLKINTNAKLTVSYDGSGNQVQNFYCGDANHCSPPSARIQSSNTEIDTTERNDTNIDLDNHFRLFPNPTKNYITLSIGKDLKKDIRTIRLYNINSVLVKEIKNSKDLSQIDLSTVAVGVYFLHVHMKKGKSITKKIIKH